MKKICTIIAAILFCSSISAVEFKDYDFQQERMLTAAEGIYMISSFEDSDLITAYSYYGDFLWETPFFAKILSWQVVGDRIIVFSKHRGGFKTYLTCLNRYSGKQVWQR